jgi:hypothetical protein
MDEDGMGAHAHVTAKPTMEAWRLANTAHRRDGLVKAWEAVESLWREMHSTKYRDQPQWSGYVEEEDASEWAGYMACTAAPNLDHLTRQFSQDSHPLSTGFNRLSEKASGVSLRSGLGAFPRAGFQQTLRKGLGRQVPQG